MRVCLLALLLAACAGAQASRILYLTHSAGFRHDCIPVSAAILQQAAAESGELEIEWSEDAGSITAENLRRFEGVLFYTSGELPLNDAQKRALIDFVHAGGGFAGVHSATDTLYGWAEYGELIGAYFDGHPWVQEVRIDIEDPGHPAVQHLAPGFVIRDEIYQFRNLSRESVRPLMTLDTSSVGLNADGVHPGTSDFPLAWTRIAGSGRVFYTALGHFEETWRDPRFQRLMMEGLRWVTKRAEGEGAPRPLTAASITAVGNAASFAPTGIVAPGALVSIYGANLTPGSNSASTGPDYAQKLAGTAVTIDGRQAAVLYASPGQLNARVPAEVEPGDTVVEVTVAGRTARAEVAASEATPGIFAVTTARRVISIWATGLGKIQQDLTTVAQPLVRIGGQDARVLYSGMTAEWPGLYQVNVQTPDNVPPGRTIVQLSMPGSDVVDTYEFNLL
jgi:uncharacterized protein (TIGR03437 family)